MGNIIEFTKRQIKEHEKFLIYISISAFVTIIDVLISRVGEFFVDRLIANTLGVVTGFIIEYCLASKRVYNSKNMRTLIIYIFTFFMGLAMANGIVYVCREFLFHNSDSFISFLISKGFSVVIPFFFMYFLRKWLIIANPQKNQ